MEKRRGYAEEREVKRRGGNVENSRKGRRCGEKEGRWRKGRDVKKIRECGGGEEMWKSGGEVEKGT